MSDAARDPMHDLVEDYVLDLLEPAERAAFDARLATDATLRAEVADARAALTSLALSTPVAPPPSLKARVMAQATAAPAEATVLPLPARRAAQGTRWLAAALAASLLLIVKLRLDLGHAERARGEAVAALDAERGALAGRDSVIAALTAPGVELVTLAATGDPKPALKVYLDPRRRRAVLTVAALGDVPAGRTYQLWFIVDGKPAPSVTFRPDAAGTALVADVPLPEGSTAAAVTVEPAGGSPAPTTTPIFSASLAAR